MQKSWSQSSEIRIRSALKGLFGELNDELYKEISDKFEGLELRDGEVLMNQGDDGDSVFMVLSGRLEVFVENAAGIRDRVGYISRGEMVGEMSLLTGDARSATTVAIRDTSLVKLWRTDFEGIISKHPELVMNITRMIIERLKRMNLQKKNPSNLVTISLVRLGPPESLKPLSDELYKNLLEFKKVIRVTRQDAVQYIGNDNFNKITEPGSYQYHSLNAWLDDKESEFDHVLMVGDGRNSEWTQRCIRQADVILIVVSGSQIPRTSDLGEYNLQSSEAWLTSNRYLVVEHENEIEKHKAKGWLTDPAINRHFHIRKSHSRDYRRLARYITGKSTGLVLSGGGAKGIAHIGILKALEERGIEFDLVGGASIGAIIGGYCAMGLNSEEIAGMTRELFMRNPTPGSELNFFPLYSLLSGRRMDKMLKKTLGVVDIEDLPLPFYCVSSNLSSSKLHIHRKGDLMTAIRASISLPGIFPPVIFEKSVLVDGGIFNNLPVDIMNKEGVSKIIAVSLASQSDHVFELDHLPGKFPIIANRLFGSGKKFDHLPTLLNTLVKSATVNSDFRERELLPSSDLLFNPDVSQFGLTNWKAFDLILEEGYRHAIELLDSLPPSHPFHT